MQNGIFNVSIGRIPPWMSVEIHVTTVCEVGVMFMSDALRYSLPQVSGQNRSIFYRLLTI